jgi:CheY-like chemotaxis protein
MQARNFKILVVEDHEDIRSAMRVRLYHLGYKVFEAANGQQGVELARAEVPDLIFMDLEMPILNGFDAIEQLQTDESCSQVPIVAISITAGTSTGKPRLCRSAVLSAWTRAS